MEARSWQMLEIFEIKKDNQFNAKYFIIVVILMFISLNQSGVVYGVNISFADLFCLICLMILIYKDSLLLPFTPVLFFVLVSIVALFSSVFFTPQIFGYNTELYKVFREYIKLFAIFIYFIIGYSLANLELIKIAIKWYSFSALLIGIAGVVVSILNIYNTVQILYDENSTRFRGLMNDPNYFSIMQIIALSYFINKRNIKLCYKLLISLIIVFSVLISGSKTGFVTFCFYVIFKAIEHFIKSKTKLNTLLLIIVLVLIIFIALMIISGILTKLTEYISSIIPSSKRIFLLFVDFREAISGEGSVRTRTWRTALEIFAFSPLTGIGVGTYSGIAELLSGSRAIAHNTYLQLLAQYGLPLTAMFISYVAYIIIKATFNNKELIRNDYTIMTLRDIIIILLIGSLAISLNNARIFWLVLGSLAFYLKTNVRIRKYKLNTANSI